MRSTFGFVLLLVAAAAYPAQAQEPGETVVESARQQAQEIVEQSRIGPAMESVAAEAVPELQEALASLAATLGLLAGRIAEDAELRASALRAAEGMIELTQAMVAESTDDLLEALRTAAERLSDMSRGDAEPASP